METGTLFKIETDRVSLTWRRVRDNKTPALKGLTNIPGRLCLRKRRDDLIFHKIYRDSVHETIASNPDLEIGPLLYEQTDYKLYVQAKSGLSVSVIHRDPLICRDLSKGDSENIVYGLINFGSQVGRSEFNVLVDGKPEVDFEVEVFPSKLDYVSDYEQILAEVQEILTGLALEYMRATFKLGTISHVPQPANIEWLLLLKSVVEKLEIALNHIAQRPIRGLVREPQTVRVEKIKRVDSAIRSAVRRGAGSGEFVGLAGGLRVRQKLEERRARPTLDTPEHRWLAAQLTRMRQRLGRLRLHEAKAPESDRRKKTLSELDELESRIAGLCKLEPIASAEGDPPTSFASLQLLGAHGYREAYQNCLILQLGLRIEGGPLRLSVKDLNQLYEYWCYLALIRIISEETGQPILAKSLFAIREQGLQVQLEKGRESTVSFDTLGNRKITVSYNPTYQGNKMLIPQKPDMLISFEDPSWPPLRLILDAKYRIDASQEYQDQYNSPGPPIDAVNVLHRYRDAILEKDSQSSNDLPKRTVVQAAALFPYRESQEGEYRNSRLWQAIDCVGIGAIPLLPGDTQYLSEWLRAVLKQGGWALADKVIPHRSTEQASDWREAASEAVLVGILRSGEKGAEANHLEWIKKEKRYYIPVKEAQKRFHLTKWIAIYEPAALRRPGAITCWAKVKEVEILQRRGIRTPWDASHGAEELQFVYQIEGLYELSRPIENQDDDGKGKAFRQHRWTSRLALQRAKNLKELLIETEPEWRLYEDLKATGISFDIEPGAVKVVNPDDPAGRAWFIVNDHRIQYRGTGGYILKTMHYEDRYFSQPVDVIRAVSAK